MQVLIVDDDAGDVRLLLRELTLLRERLDLSIATVNTLAAAMDRLNTGGIDLVLLDLGLPDSSGLETLDQVCARHRRLPIVVLTGLDSEEAGLDALRRGASDYLIKGKFNADLLLRTIRYSLERKRLEQQLLHQALHDPLTGVLNRRAFEEELRRVVEQARRGRRAALLLLDIDHFKQINDTMGHNVGDELLVGLTSAVRGQLREGDALARLGGDEFAVLLAEADLPRALEVGDRLCRAALGMRWNDGQDLRVSLSVGAVAIDGTLESEELVRAADACMYRAKVRGRNQVFAA